MRALLVTILLVAASTTAQPLITAVVPDLPGIGPGDEAFAIGCNTPCDLTGWSLTDGEGTYYFDEGTTLAAGEQGWFVGNAAKWARFDMPTPRAEFDGPQLANTGDQVRLDGEFFTEDAFAYGDETDGDIEGSITYRSPGLIYTRLKDAQGHWVDTDHADDWRTPRTHRVGESNLDQPTFDIDAVTLYASPDSSFKTLRNLMASAQERVALHVYQLRSASLADALIAAGAREGVSLDVLVTRSPIGMDADDRHETAHILQRVQEVGGSAVLADNDRYDYHHLKVLIVDDAVAIQSENWVPSGVPENPRWGNRGWGIILHDADAADWFANWMADDRNAWDSEEFDLATYDPQFEQPIRFEPRTGDNKPVPSKRIEGPIRVTPVVAPDHIADPATDPIAAVAQRAQTRLLVQQLDLTLGAKNNLGFFAYDPLADAIVAAAKGGAATRVQVAAPFARDDTGNAEALLWMQEQAFIATDVLDRPGLATMHNKGIVADDHVVIGSINGNHHSRSENREVSVIIESGAVADYFAALFEKDFGAESTFSIEEELPATPVPILLVMLSVLAIRPWRQSRQPSSSSR